MSSGHQIPNRDYRAELEALLNDIERASNALPDNADEADPSVADNLDQAQRQLQKATDTIQATLKSLPEWDRDLIRDILLEHATRSDTTVERVDQEIVFKFEAGRTGNKTECRYAVRATSGQEWFHVRRDGEWNEVWSN